MNELRNGSEIRLRGPVPVPEPEPICEERVGEIRSINIEPLNYGYIVKVGCQKLAFETYEKLISCLTDYMKDPAGIEKAWFAGNYLRNK